MGAQSNGVEFYNSPDNPAIIIHDSESSDRALSQADIQLVNDILDNIEERYTPDTIVRVYGKAKVHGIAYVNGNATICGTAEVDGHAVISHDAIVNDRSSYVVLPTWWASGRYTTWTRSNNMWYVYDFYGTGQELIRKAYNDSEKSGREYERLVKYVNEILKETEK